MQRDVWATVGSALEFYSAGKTLTVNAADLADVRWLQERVPHTP